MPDSSPFHAGEQAVQSRLGVRDTIEPWARQVVRPFLPEQHREFYSQLPFLVAAARDAEGRPWATVLAGAAGFVRSPSPGELRIATRTVPGDALENDLAPGTDIGLLGIDLATRRRNRVNGRIVAHGVGVLDVGVDQAFGNCPQYIRERSWQGAAPNPKPRVERAPRLDRAQQRAIAAADTLFIASGHRGSGDDEAFGMDASHRGGEPGFVRIADERTLVLPDYSGNNHFNTIGNLVLDPRAGLLFVDFETGGLLQLTGRIEIDWDSPAVAGVPGARRLLTFHIEQVVTIEDALPLRWRGSERAVRTLRVIDKRRESSDITSFVLEARDGGALTEFTAGQHLPIELDVPELGPVRRTYSLSNEPGQGRYRISVKRDPLGTASRHLHDVVERGDFLASSAPGGEFVLRHGRRPIVLASAGVGVTPMLSMLRELVATRDSREIYFFHGAHDGASHAFADEVRGLAAAGKNVAIDVSYSRPGVEDEAGRDFDHTGRLGAERIAARLPDLNADFYLCGPNAFMADLQRELELRGVSPSRIRSEGFGPA